MLLGILLGILCGILTGCQTSNQTVVVQEGGGGPCGPNCAPSRSRVIREREVVMVQPQPCPPRRSFIQVHIVPGGGCPPRGGMIHRPMMVGQQCPPQGWGQQQYPPQGWGQPQWGGPQYGGQSNGLTWGNPNGGPGGYR